MQDDVSVTQWRKGRGGKEKEWGTGKSDKAEKASVILKPEPSAWEMSRDGEGNELLAAQGLLVREARTGHWKLSEGEGTTQHGVRGRCTECLLCGRRGTTTGQMKNSDVEQQHRK